MRIHIDIYIYEYISSKYIYSREGWLPIIGPMVLILVPVYDASIPHGATTDMKQPQQTYFCFILINLSLLSVDNLSKLILTIISNQLSIINFTYLHFSK